ncbi:MAG TPA: ABC transporter permease [Blastocatellia bacterium]|nr:ABC transporter permease [Blastocatellia bacterium]
MENLVKDVKYGLRMLRKNPGFTFIAVASLALGIGANTAMFSLINAFLLAPLPVDHASRLVTMFTVDQKNPGNLETSDLNYQDYRNKNDVFSGVLGYSFAGVSFTSGSESKQLFAELVSGNYFDVLGVKITAGRSFMPDEDKPGGGAPVAVISYGLWQRQFAGRPDVVGRSISLNRHDFTIVGVAVKDFTGTDLGGGPDLWVPLSTHEITQPGFDWYNTRRGLFINMIGRLKPDTNIQQARADMTALSSQLEQEYSADNKGRGIKLMPLLQARVDPTGQGQFLLKSALMMVLVIIVLLIACTNIANLLLPRAMARKKEIAIRLATGASRSRLISQLMTESVMLSIIGGAAGVLIAVWANVALGSLDLFGAFGPNPPAPRLDLGVLLFTAVITLGSALVFGLAPAIQATKPQLVSTLKGEISPVSRGTLGLSLRKALVVTQVALSLVSLVAAGLFIRSLREAQQINPGFVTDKMLTMNIDLGQEGYTIEKGQAFERQLVDRLRTVAGVKAAAVARDGPFAGGISRSVFIEGQEPGSNGKGVLVQTNDIGPGYLQTLGIQVSRGRDFTEQDSGKAPKIVIINETMAEQFWPRQDPVGKRFKFFGDPDFREVAGVARDVKYNSLVEDKLPFVYIPLEQEYSAAVTLYVRTQTDPHGIIPGIQSEIRSMDAGLPVLGIKTLNEIIDQSLVGQKTGAGLLAVFGAMALLLAAIGLYGVMSYSVAQRTREIGIRMALGANSGNVVSMVLGQGMLLVGIGLGAGLGVALVVTRFIATLLFGISPIDPVTFAAMPVLLGAVALLANYLPARKATRVNPVVALKYD